MQSFPETPPLAKNPELSGHVWVQELVTGEPLRFRVAPSGLVEFGARGEVFGSDDVPLRFGCAARSVRESLDLSALRGSVDDTASVTFLGTATLYDGVGYDWSRLPPFLGVDVWSDEKDGYLTPDAASTAYESLGLTPLPAFEKETAAERAPLDAYVSGDLPESRFRDGPAAGVLVRDKSGGRGETRRSTPDRDADPDGVERYVTDDRIGAVLEGDGADDGGDADTDTLIDRVAETVVREEYANLYRGDEPVDSEREIRSAVAERVRRRLG